jgi:hypothetical protein
MKLETNKLKIENNNLSSGTQVIECLLSKCKALNSAPSTTKTTNQTNTLATTPLTMQKKPIETPKGEIMELDFLRLKEYRRP